MDRQQAVNLGLMRAFEREGITFAQPTPALRLELPREASREGEPKTSG